MTTDKKLYIALAVLAVLGGAVFMQNKKKAADAQAHSLEGAAESLPKIALTEEQTKTIDKIEIQAPAKGDGGAATQVQLIKKGEEDWDVAEPVKAKANASNVKSLIENLTRLEIKEQIDSTNGSYDKFDLSDDKALHAVFFKGDEKVADLYFGENGSRGQMTRIAGKDGVYAVKGYSSYLYGRDVAGWRDKTIFKFEDKDAVKVTIQNENGEFVFEKNGEDWTAKHAKKAGQPGTALKDFDKGKLESLLRAYKSLNASEFGDGKKPSDVGLEEPIATVTIELKGGSGRHVLSVGDTAEGSNRWVMKNGSDQIFSISSWGADWATANVDKFAAGKDDEGDSDDDPTAAMPPGMPGMPGMPPGH